MGSAGNGADAPTAKHFLLGAGVEYPLEIEEPSDEVRDSPDGLAIDHRDFARAGVNGIDSNIGCRFRAAEDDDLLSFDEGRVGMLRGMQDPAACRLEGIFAGVTDHLRFVELAGADGDKVKFPVSSTAIGIPDFQRPAR